MFKFSEYLLETKLFEMAYKRKRILEEVHNLMDQILIHIVKIKFFYDQNDYNGHVRSINTWLHKIQDMTLDGKNRLKKDEYFKELFLSPIDSGDDFKNRYKRLKILGYKPSSYNNFEEFYKIAKRAFQDISEDISLNKFETIEKYFDFRDLK